MGGFSGQARARAQGTEVIIGDDTGNIKAVWFNNTWLARSLKPNQRIAVGGKVKVFRGRKVFENPEHEIISENNRTHTGRMVPIYPLTDGLYQRSVRNLVRRALDLSLSKVSEVLHEDLIRRRDLLGIREAISPGPLPRRRRVKGEGAYTPRLRRALPHSAARPRKKARLATRPRGQTDSYRLRPYPKLRRFPAFPSD